MKANPEVSQNFENAFSSGVHGCLHTCNCGAVHYDTHNHWDWNEGEMDNLEKLHKDTPNKYLPQDNAISTYEVDGRIFVSGCACNGGGKYEAFIIRHARQIAAYLNARAEDLASQAASMKVGQ